MRSPLMLGDWNDPEKSAAAYCHGWLHKTAAVAPRPHTGATAASLIGFGRERQDREA